MPQTIFISIAKANWPGPILSFEYIEKKENDSATSFFSNSTTSFLLNTTISSSSFTRLSPRYLLKELYSNVLTFLSEVLSKK